VGEEGLRVWDFGDKSRGLVEVTSQPGGPREGPAGSTSTPGTARTPRSPSRSRCG